MLEVRENEIEFGFRNRIGRKRILDEIDMIFQAVAANHCIKILTECRLQLIGTKKAALLLIEHKAAIRDMKAQFDEVGEARAGPADEPGARVRPVPATREQERNAA